MSSNGHATISGMNLIILQAYQEEDGKELNSQFYINYLTALDHLIFLTLAEPHTFTLESRKKSCSINDAAAVLLMYVYFYFYYFT